MQNLDTRIPITNPDGTPTQFFMDYLLRRGVGQQTLEEQVESILALELAAGDGLDGGGFVQAAITADPLTPQITLTADVQEILDQISTTRGTLLYRGAAAWAGLAPGTSGHFLKTLGAGADPAWAAVSSAVADGDYGDITVSGGGAAWVVDNDAITYAKIQNVSSVSKLLGRGDSGGAGDVQEISLGSNLAMVGTTLSASVTGGGGGGVRAPAGWNAGIGMIRETYADAATATMQMLGWSQVTVGTSGTPSLATTNRVTKMNRFTRLSTTANAEFGGRYDAGSLVLTPADGLIYEGLVGWEVGATMSEKRMFVGFKAADSFPGPSTDPSSLLNIAGIGADTADANWHIMYNDAAGTATKVDTGWAKTLGELIFVRVTMSSTEVKIYAEKYAATNYTMSPTATFAEQTYSSNIPVSSTATAPIWWGANGATAENGTLAKIYQRLVSPF